MNAEQSKEELKSKLDQTRIPPHVAIIMDGNGRWALEHGLSRQEGHRQGVEAVRETVRFSSELGIKYLTMFAFSTENWLRPANEVNYLMSLPKKYFDTELPELICNNIKVNLLGDLDQLPGKARKAVFGGVEATKNNSGMILSFALNYGSRSELIMAINKVLSDFKNGNLKGKITENVFNRYLYTCGIPDPDLLIRTSGEMRISNFLLWQIAYSELWFSEVYWPDFKPNHLLEAVLDYQQRKRRFGKL